MSTALVGLLVSAPLLAGSADADALELRYQGALAQVARSGERTPAKRFDVMFLVLKTETGGSELAFVVEERGGGAWPWPERFGLVELDAQLKPQSKLTPRLLQDHNGTLNPVPLPLALFGFNDRLKADASWTEGRQHYQVVRQRKVNDRDCWHVEVSTNFGRQQDLMIEVGSGLVVSLDGSVFMGQGDRYQLTMELESAKPLDNEALMAARKPLETLSSLQKTLNRQADDTSPMLDEAQVRAAEAVLDDLQQQAAATPFKSLSAAIGRDVMLQAERIAGIKGLAEKYIGKASPTLALKSVANQPIDAQDLDGKIVLLHFWDYKHDPLVEPYGQIGYLDFLNNQRGKLGVKVLGVAVDADAGDPAKRPALARSIRRLQESFNLSYEIAVDDGALLQKFGDPRRLGAQLPLWVLIGPDGKVVRYDVGFFNVNPNEGLRVLDDAVIALLKQKRGGESR